MKCFSLLIFLLFVLPLSIAEAENRNHSLKSEIMETSSHHNHNSSRKHFRSLQYHGSFSGQNHFFLYVDGYHISPYLRYYQPHPKQVVIQNENQPIVVREKTIIKTRYVPAEKEPAPRLCGGETIYQRDRTTGELIIRYVTPATDC